MTDRKKLLGRSFSKYRDFIETESIARIKSIAQELEEIKDLVNKIEASKNLQINKAELDRIENRLNILEFELYYGPLN